MMNIRWTGLQMGVPRPEKIATVQMGLCDDEQGADLSHARQVLGLTAQDAPAMQVRATVGRLPEGSSQVCRLEVGTPRAEGPPSWWPATTPDEFRLVNDVVAKMPESREKSLVQQVLCAVIKNTAPESVDSSGT